MYHCIISQLPFTHATPQSTFILSRGRRATAQLAQTPTAPQSACLWSLGTPRHIGHRIAERHGVHVAVAAATDVTTRLSRAPRGSALPSARETLTRRDGTPPSTAAHRLNRRRLRITAPVLAWQPRRAVRRACSASACAAWWPRQQWGGDGLAPSACPQRPPQATQRQATPPRPRGVRGGRSEEAAQRQLRGGHSAMSAC